MTPKSRREFIPALFSGVTLASMNEVNAQLFKLSRDADRIRELSALLPLWPKDLADTTLDGRRRIVSAMERALRAERRRGREGHWAYDLSRHAALLRAWKRERAEIAALEAARRR